MTDKEKVALLESFIRTTLMVTSDGDVLSMYLEHVCLVEDQPHAVEKLVREVLSGKSQ